MFPIKYKNGNYEIRLYHDGTKIRLLDDKKFSKFEPAFAECIDMTITEKCNYGCSFCYLGCTSEKKHPDLDSDGINTFIKSLNPGTEVAININDVEQPGLENFLMKLRNQKVVTNATVSFKELVKHESILHEWQKKQLIFGIGISTSIFDYTSVKLIKSFKNSVIHIIAGVLNEKDLKDLMNSIETIPFVRLLVLGYKNLGRACLNEKVKDNIDLMKDYIPRMLETTSVLSFDNLAIEQLDVKSMFLSDTWEKIFMGNEGEFTYYVNLTDMTYGINSIAPSNERYEMKEQGYDSVQMFRYLKEKL